MENKKVETRGGKASVNMKIFVKAKPNAKENSIKKIDETHFEMAIKEPPTKGKANSAIIKVIAAHFGVAISQVRLVSGFSSREKYFEIK